MVLLLPVPALLDEKLSIILFLPLALYKPIDNTFWVSPCSWYIICSPYVVTFKVPIELLFEEGITFILKGFNPPLSTTVNTFSSIAIVESS